MNASQVGKAITILGKYINLDNVQVESNKEDVTFIFLVELDKAYIDLIYQDLLCYFYERDIACSIQEERFQINISW